MEPDPVLMPLTAISDPDPGQDVAIDLDIDNNCARVVFFFDTNETAFRAGNTLNPRHQQGIDILKGILGAAGSQAEFYGCCDTTGSDDVNNRVANARIMSVVFGLHDSDVTFQPQWTVFNFGEQFAKDPLSVSNIADAEPLGDKTSSASNRVVVVYAWPSVSLRFGGWMDEPHRMFGLIHPEFLIFQSPVIVID